MVTCHSLCTWCLLVTTYLALSMNFTFHFQSKKIFPDELGRSTTLKRDWLLCYAIICQYLWKRYTFDSLWLVLECIRLWFKGLFVLLFGENPQAVAYSAQPLCWSSWENSSPTIHRGAVRKVLFPYLISPLTVLKLPMKLTMSNFYFTWKL